jgi:hypothetical protein
VGPTRTLPSLGTGQQPDRPGGGGNWAHRQDHSPEVVRPPDDLLEWMADHRLTDDCNDPCSWVWFET